MPHTKGPWGAGQLAGRDAFHVMSGSFTVADVYREEDARLIAAAPELLEALENLADDCLVIAEGLNDYPPCTQPALNRNEASRKLKQYAADARAAIAKARGEK